MKKYIIEASKKDADKLSDYGEKKRVIDDGARINEHLTPKIKFNSETGEKEKIYNKDKIIDDNKNHTRKENIRKSSDSKTVPNHGANPRYSSDISDRATRQFEKSKRYKGVDLDLTADKFTGKKKEIVKRMIDSGKDVPESVKKQFVNKKDIKPVEKSRIIDRSKNFINLQFPESSDSAKKAISLSKIIRRTKDYNEYTKAFKELIKLAGFNYDEVGGIGSLHSTKNGCNFNIFSQGKQIKINKDTPLYHSSEESDIKNLVPTFKAPDGIYYKEPRVYFGKGRSMEKVGAGNTKTGTPVYSTTKIKSVNHDDEYSSDIPVYKTTYKKIKVNK